MVLWVFRCPTPSEMVMVMVVHPSGSLCFFRRRKRRASPPAADDGDDDDDDASLAPHHSNLRARNIPQHIDPSRHPSFKHHVSDANKLDKLVSIRPSASSPAPLPPSPPLHTPQHLLPYIHNPSKTPPPPPIPEPFPPPRGGPLVLVPSKCDVRFQ
jgi:hypothetical protein